MVFEDTYMFVVSALALLLPEYASYMVLFSFGLYFALRMLAVCSLETDDEDSGL